MLGNPALLSLEATIDHCRTITHRSRNNLARAARRFDEPAREELFVVTYASMRVIDDYVDDLFLCRDAADRKREREGVAAQLDRIYAQVSACATGRFRPESGSFEPVVFAALNELLPRTGLGVGPWRALIDSLRLDVEEMPADSWGDYLAYCEGACVAPASVFVHVVACDAHTLQATLPHPLEWYARPLAIFSYLAHMLRDLDRDARGAPQLFAVPRAVLRDSGLTLDEARRASRQEQWKGLRRMISAISAEAGRWRRDARARLDEARGHLKPDAWELLDEIAWMYERVLIQARRDLLD